MKELKLELDKINNQISELKKRKSEIEKQSRLGNQISDSKEVSR